MPTRSHSITLSAWANTVSGKVRPSAAAVLRFGQVPRLAALPGASLQYLVDVNSSFAPHLRQARAVAHQAATATLPTTAMNARHFISMPDADADANAYQKPSLIVWPK